MVDVATRVNYSLAITVCRRITVTTSRARDGFDRQEAQSEFSPGLFLFYVIFYILILR